MRSEGCSWETWPPRTGAGTGLTARGAPAERPKRPRTTASSCAQTGTRSGKKLWAEPSLREILEELPEVTLHTGLAVMDPEVREARARAEKPAEVVDPFQDKVLPAVVFTDGSAIHPADRWMRRAAWAVAWYRAWGRVARVRLCHGGGPNGHQVGVGGGVVGCEEGG